MDDFYTLLIKDKAIHLAYYFMINGLLDYDKLNTEYYLREIKNGYDTTIKNLNSEKLKKNSKDISIFAQQITKQNELLNIYKSNYGTEGHIINFLKYKLWIFRYENFIL